MQIATDGNDWIIKGEIFGVETIVFRGTLYGALKFRSDMKTFGSVYEDDRYKDKHAVNVRREQDGTKEVSIFRFRTQDEAEKARVSFLKQGYMPA